MRSQPTVPGFGPGEVKFLPQPLRESGEDGVFEGYASLFGTPDLGRDVVMPGAFAESLSRRGTAGIRMLWQHDPAEPVGIWLSLSEDHKGLRVRGRLNPAVERAREIAALMKQGAIDGLSIGFRVVEARKDPKGGLRRLYRLDLWEISIVTFPMLPGARVERDAALPQPSPKRAGEHVALAATIRRATRRISRPSTTTRN